jgi:PiT family inorganic phosphate transporter
LLHHKDRISHGVHSSKETGRNPSRGKGRQVDQILLIFGIALAFLYAFFTGFHDGGNLIATNVLSRSIAPKKALYLACAGEFFGPFILGSAVAVTLGREIFGASSLNGSASILSLCAGLVSAITWGLMTWWVGMPPGSTHTLLGGLIGGLVAAFGLSGIICSVAMVKILLALLMAPLVGFVASALSVRLFKVHLSRGQEGYRRQQEMSLLLLSAGHGANNAQRATALIVMMLLASGSLKLFKIPLWATTGAAATLAVGVSMGAWKIVRLLGTGNSRISPSHALACQGTAALVVLAANLLGCPVSTSQIVKSSLLGSGAPRRQKALGKILMKNVFTAWIVNFPASAVMAAAIYWTTAPLLGQGMGSFERIMKAIGQ